MPRKGNIIGQVFDEEIIKQIGIREEFLGQRTKNDANLIYQNNQTAFLRLSSSVNVGDEVTSVFTTNLNEKGGDGKIIKQNQTVLNKQLDGAKVTTIEKDTDGDGNNDTVVAEVTENKLEEGKNQLKQRSINENMTGMELAKSCILFGGTVGVDNNLNPQQKFGIVDKVDGETDFVNNIAAYGWGGLGKKGYAPMPAIVDAKVSFYNRGAIQKAEVKIKVYSLEQLQIFDVLYFRIGYSMLLEWGHNVWINNKSTKLKNRDTFSTEPLKKFFTKDTSQQQILSSIKDQRLLDSFNYDAMLGKVTNFTWKFNDDGTYDINLKLIGMGDIIESLKVNKSPLRDESGSKKLTRNEQIKKRTASAGQIDRSVQAKNKQINEEVSNLSENAAKELEDINNKIQKLGVDFRKILRRIDDGDRQAWKNGKLNGATFTASTPYNGFLKNFLGVQWVGGKYNPVNENGFTRKFPFTGTSSTSWNKLEAGRKKFSTPYVEGQTMTGRDFPQFIASQDLDQNKNVVEQVRSFAEEVKSYFSSVKSTGGIVNDRITNPLINNLQKVVNLIANYSKITIKKLDNAKSKQEEIKAEGESRTAAATRLREQAQRDKDILAIAPETSRDNKNKSLFNQQLVKWRDLAQNFKPPTNSNEISNYYKLQFTSNDTDVSQSGVSSLTINFYYVRLGFMLEWIEDNLLIYDSTKKDENAERGNPIFKIDYSSDDNFCLRFPGQHSSDPKVCVIPSMYSQGDSKWNILSDLQEVSPYFIEGNEGAGRVMNMMVNIDNIAAILNKNMDSNGKINLNTFLTGLLNDINDSLGNVNKLEPIFNTEELTLTILDANNVPNAEKSLKTKDEFKKSGVTGVFNVYGIGNNASQKGSFVTNVDFQVQLPPNMAAMATISAQANGNIVGENATGLSQLNTGLTDRIVTTKIDASNIEGYKSGNEDPSKLFNNTIKLVNSSINDLYKDRIFAKDTVASMRSNNRDIALYITGNESYLKTSPPPFFIPFNLRLDMQGLSGMRNYERFSITEEVLPYSYRSGNGQGGKINFLIKGISHKIGNNEWTTNIESLSVGAKKVNT